MVPSARLKAARRFLDALRGLCVGSNECRVVLGEIGEPDPLVARPDIVDEPEPARLGGGLDEFQPKTSSHVLALPLSSFS